MALPILQDTFRNREERRPVVVAQSSFSFGGGIALGLLLGGYFGQIQEWEWVYWSLFYLNFPCLIIALLFQRETKPQQVSPFDWVGFFSLSLTFLSLLVIVTQGKAEWNTLGFYSPFILFFWSLAALSLIIFLYNTKTNPHAILDLSLFSHRPFVIGFFAIIPVAFLVFGVTLATLGIIREDYGYQWIDLAYLMAPVGVIYCIFGAIPTLLTPYIHPRVFVFLGLSLIVWANWSAQTLTIQSDWNELFYVISLRAIGVALSLGPITTLALYQFHGEMYEKGAQMFQFIRMMGACFGSSIIQLISAYRVPFHALRYGEQINPYSASFQNYLKSYEVFARNRGFHPNQVMDEIRQWIVKQAEIQSILDAEYLLSILIVAMLFVFLLTWISGFKKVKLLFAQ